MKRTNSGASFKRIMSHMHIGTFARNTLRKTQQWSGSVHRAMKLQGLQTSIEEPRKLEAATWPDILSNLVVCFRQGLESDCIQSIIKRQPGDKTKSTLHFRTSWLHYNTHLTKRKELKEQELTIKKGNARIIEYGKDRTYVLNKPFVFNCKSA
jgi:hypothetical protein